jgi:hypothetical protein
LAAFRYAAFALHGESCAERLVRRKAIGRTLIWKAAKKASSRGAAPESLKPRPSLA